MAKKVSAKKTGEPGTPSHGDSVNDLEVVDPNEAVADVTKEIDPEPEAPAPAESDPVGSIDNIRRSLKSLVAKAFKTDEKNVTTRHEKQSVFGPIIEASVGASPFAAVRLISKQGKWKAKEDFDSEVYAFLDRERATALRSALESLYGGKAGKFNR